MANYVFLNMPAWGHVNPTLAVVQELVKRGHRVSYYITEEFREIVEATGAIFQAYESTRDILVSKDGSQGFGRGPAFMAEDMRHVPPQVIDRIRAEQPDAIIYDFMCAWALVVIDALQVPAIALRATYASNEHFNIIDHMKAGAQNNPGMQQFMGRVKAFQATQSGSGADPLSAMFNVFTRSEQLNIIFLPRLFQPMAETFDERYVFVGPSILPRHQTTAFPFDRLNDQLPLLYISLGTVANNQSEFYKLCFEAFKEQPWQVVLSVGKHIDQAQLGPIPTNFLLSSFVPQLDLLPRTSVFVTHAGTNSLMESLYYGVPMVMVPQQPEQQMHTQRATELGLGLPLDKATMTAATLREAVERVARDAHYREHAQNIQQLMSEAGGYQQAADAIVRFTQRIAV